MDNISNTVMQVFKAFGAEKRKYSVRLTKIGCVDGHPPKIVIGQAIEGIFDGEVKIGISFNIEHALIVEGNSPLKRIFKGEKYDMFCTSIIHKILTNDTFETKNSIYKWEIINS